MLLYDLAVPRDVDPAVGALPYVELIDLDGLCRDLPYLPRDRSGLAEARTIGDRCVEDHVNYTEARRAAPLIADLQVRLERRRDQALSRTLASLEHLPAADRATVALLAHRLTNGAFHELVTTVKGLSVRPDGACTSSLSSQHTARLASPAHGRRAGDEGSIFKGDAASI